MYPAKENIFKAIMEEADQMLYFCHDSSNTLKYNHICYVSTLCNYFSYYVSLFVHAYMLELNLFVVCESSLNQFPIFPIKTTFGIDILGKEMGRFILCPAV